MRRRDGSAPSLALLLPILIEASLPRDGAQRNSAEIQQSGHARRSGLEIKNGRCNAKDGVPTSHCGGPVPTLLSRGRGNFPDNRGGRGSTVRCSRLVIWAPKILST